MHDKLKGEEAMLDDIFGDNGSRQLWKGKYRVSWCGTCRTAYIACVEPNCDGTSCNGGGCEKCHEDFVEFHTCKTSIEDYLSDDEIETYRKIIHLQSLILESLRMGDKEIDFEKMNREDLLTEYSKKLFNVQHLSRYEDMS